MIYPPFTLIVNGCNTEDLALLTEVKTSSAMQYKVTHRKNTIPQQQNY